MPVNRYETPAKAPKPAAKVAAPVPVAASEVDVAAIARQVAANAQDLDGLRAALAGFEHCDLKKGARSLVFSDGNPSARVMIIGEAPGREEDRAGKPFVGAAGQLLDAMLASIDHGRDHAEHPVYITNILPWRPPNNRDPSPEEIAMMVPFVERHVALANPDVIVLMGNIACLAMLGLKGITKLRGTWTEVYGKPTLPMFHPAYLLRQAAAKREAWHDLLMLQAKVRG